MSLGLAKIVLGPVLLAQGRRVRRDTPRLPEAEGERSGLEGEAGAQSPLRLLVLGDSSAAGVGVARQEEALAQPMARALAKRLGRPVSWRLDARSGIGTEEAIELLRAGESAPSDVIATALGMNDVTGQRGERAFLRDVAELWRVAFSRTGARFGVVTGLPPLHRLPAMPQPLRWYLGRYAAHLDSALSAWVATQPQLGFCSLQFAAEPGAVATDGFHPGPRGYARWSEAMAEKVADAVGRA